MLGISNLPIMLLLLHNIHIMTIIMRIEGRYLCLYVFYINIYIRLYRYKWTYCKPSHDHNLQVGPIQDLGWTSYDAHWVKLCSIHNSNIYYVESIFNAVYRDRMYVNVYYIDSYVYPMDIPLVSTSNVEHLTLIGFIQNVGGQIGLMVGTNRFHIIVIVVVVMDF